jgi:protease IV
MDNGLPADGSRPYATPPPPLRAPSPRRTGPSGNRALIWILLIGALGLVLIAVMGSLLLQAVRQVTLGSGTLQTTRAQLQEVLLENNASRHKIAVIDLASIITSSSRDRSGYGLVEYIRDQLELAARDSRVRAVILSIDSPGGEVLASDEIHRAIREFQDNYGRPVIASMQSLAASGGYYAAVPCRWIVAHELTLTGSIGVVLHGYNYRGLLNKVGVRPEVYKSGRFKDMLSPDRLEEEITPEERQMLQTLVDETFARFKSVVREGRTAAARANGNLGRPLAPDWEDFADGRILSGQQAFEHGFVDELGNFDTARERALELAKIPDANLVRYQRPFDLGSLFRLFGQSESATVQIDIGLDLPKLHAGHLYFLSPALFD